MQVEEKELAKMLRSQARKDKKKAAAAEEIGGRNMGRKFRDRADEAEHLAERYAGGNP